MRETNGVSFALVAGAICFVKYANVQGQVSGWNATGSWNNAWTLNINSTGAKYVTAYCSKTNASTKSSSANKGDASKRTWSDTNLNTHAIIHIYSGSEYIVDEMWRTYDYSDYAD